MEPEPEPPTERRGGGACAALYTYNPETGQCELPPNSIQPPVEAEPEPEPEPEPVPDPGNEDQNGGSSNEEVDDDDSSATDDDNNSPNEEGDNSGSGDE